MARASRRKALATSWLIAHTRLVWLGAALMAVGLATAAAWRFEVSHVLVRLSSRHAQSGAAIAVLLMAHVLLAILRPPKTDTMNLMIGMPPKPSNQRRLWEIAHRLAAFALFAIAAFSLVTGAALILERYDVALPLPRLVKAQPPPSPPPSSPPPPSPPGPWRAAAAVALNGTAPPGCSAFPVHHLGDGWCDDVAPFNTAACHYDYGDCCGDADGDGSIGAVISPILQCKDPSSPHFGSAPSPTGTYPAPRNPRYNLDEGRTMTAEGVATSYNNYYEWSFLKDEPAKLAAAHKAFYAGPWRLSIGGAVDAPIASVDVWQLIGSMHLEERIYAHRCVEGWSMVVPWVGFPLSKLLDLVAPHGDAAYVLFQTYSNRSHGHFPPGWPWPFKEALTIAEARNELAFLAVGLFQSPLTAQNGAPIRLVLPWKYGFKSIKALSSIRLVTEAELRATQTYDTRYDQSKPTTFWSTYTDGSEYGFWANVNPAVPHPRWSQARERVLDDSAYMGPRRRSEIFNGYGKQVQHLYEGMDGERLFV